MSLPADINEAPDWIVKNGPDKDIVVSSRLRFARNLSGIPFPLKASAESKEKILNGVEDFLESLDWDRDFNFVKMDELNSFQKEVVQERRLGSEELTDERYGAVVFDELESLGFLVNEEDHFRIQSLSAGYDLDTVRTDASRLETSLDEEFGFASDPEWGYLTACPTNLGTGMRASVLLHLPGLIMRDEIQKVLKAIANLGLTVRGYYGEGTESEGYYLQLSNQVTLGRSVDSLLDSLSRVTERLINKERKARHKLFERSGMDMEDQIYRAYGTIQYARKIGSAEALKCLSLCRFGNDAGLIDTPSISEIDRLTMQLQPAHLNLSVGERLSSADRDTYRARLLRKALNNKSNDGETHETLETECTDE